MAKRRRQLIVHVSFPTSWADFNEHIIGELDDLGAVPRKYRAITVGRDVIFFWRTSSIVNAHKLVDVLSHAGLRRARVYLHELRPRLRLIPGGNENPARWWWAA